jgi:microcompartment protein CcmL/EutN
MEGFSLEKMVSLNVIENAFDEVLTIIDEMEETVESQTEIELNQMKIAQLEKILFVHSQLVKLEEGVAKKEKFMPYKVAFSR